MKVKNWPEQEGGESAPVLKQLKSSNTLSSCSAHARSLSIFWHCAKDQSHLRPICGQPKDLLLLRGASAQWQSLAWRNGGNAGGNLQHILILVAQLLGSWRRPHANMRPLGGWALALNSRIFACISTNTAVLRAHSWHRYWWLTEGSRFAACNCELSDHVTAVTANHGDHIILNPAPPLGILNPLKGVWGAGSMCSMWNVCSLLKNIFFFFFCQVVRGNVPL